MNKQANNNKQEINGIFIYHDPKKGCVYYDIIKKNGYILSRSDYQTYSRFATLKLLSIFSIFLFIELLHVEIWEATLIGLALFVAIEVIFRTSFIYKLPKIEKYKPIKKDKLYEVFAEKLSLSRLIITTTMALTASILIVVYASLQEYEGLNKIITYVLAMIMFIMFVNGIIAIYNKMKNKKQRVLSIAKTQEELETLMSGYRHQDYYWGEDILVIGINHHIQDVLDETNNTEKQ